MAMFKARQSDTFVFAQIHKRERERLSYKLSGFRERKEERERENVDGTETEPLYQKTTPPSSLSYFHNNALSQFFFLLTICYFYLFV